MTLPATNGLSALELAGALDAEWRVRDCIEAGLCDSAIAFDTRTIDPVFDPFKSSFDLIERLFLVLQHAQRKLLFVVVGPDIRHVDRHTREIAAGFAPSLAQCRFGHRMDVSSKSC